MLELDGECGVDKRKKSDSVIIKLKLSFSFMSQQFSRSIAEKNVNDLINDIAL